ncbi:HAD family hydrolase [Levilactobacillus yiduensis]|uniref:HAD-IIB family hydrolase n=1 Tax=Levilactobacillus yiduensis TaxID=2953880 RepID=UPI000EF348BF|nr:HAD family hydrolase [Levilactobacillus yiduensis]AYM03692.1 HAD family phosphatase [Levilactobacillus brevis]
MKTFVFDVDGTLSFDGQEIAQEVRQALQQLVNHGHRVIFASARPIRDLLPIIPGFHESQLIGANGALISQNGDVQTIATIPPADLRRLRGVISQANLDYVVDARWNYAARVAATHPLAKRIDPAKLAQCVPLSAIRAAIKVTLIGLPAQQTRELQETLQVRRTLTVVANAEEGNLDITARHIDKATTLLRLGVTDYVAFGNDQNDLAMLAGAQHSVWVTSKPQLAHLSTQATVTCAPTSQAVAAQIAQLI